MRIVDELILDMVSGIDVDVMPGKQDPVSQIMPQQRIQPSMFEHSCKYSSFQSVTNPYSFSSNGAWYLLLM
jgi:DNA polymerase II small subunit/DNA polymerase delta subunit B